jgi:hypothetical protein
MAWTSKDTKRVAIVIAVSLLAGACATAAQRQYQAMATNGQSSSQSLQACVRPVWDAPENAPLRARMPFKVIDATLQQMSDKDFASDEEIQTILVVHPKLNSCRQAFLTQLSQTSPSISVLYASTFADNEHHLIDLIDKKERWGEYVRGAKQRVTELQLRLTQESQRITAGLDQSHQAELARRQAAANAMSQYLQTQQIINNMNRPVVTNCNQFGNMVNCVSR